MKIRKLVKSDYPVIDFCMQELHTLHVNGRPDIYAPSEKIILRLLQQTNKMKLWDFVLRKLEEKVA